MQQQDVTYKIKKVQYEAEHSNFIPEKLINTNLSSFG